MGLAWSSVSARHGRSRLSIASRRISKVLTGAESVPALPTFSRRLVSFHNFFSNRISMTEAPRLQMSALRSGWLVGCRKSSGGSSMWRMLALV